MLAFPLRENAMLSIFEKCRNIFMIVVFRCCASALLGALILSACSILPTASPSEDALPHKPEQLASGLVSWEGWEAERHLWYCEAGAKPLQIYYLRDESGQSEFIFLHASGVSSLMRPWPAASGMRFVSFDEQQSFRWHERGDDGRLSFLAADDMAWEEPVLRNCRRWRRGE